MTALFSRPFALSIGPQRCGASFLQAYFKSRQDVCLPKRVDEVFFFDRHFQRGDDFYTGHFDVQDQHAIVLEVTTTIFDALEAPQHLYDVSGDDVTLFCFLRDPVARAYAVYQDLMRYGIVTGGLEEAVEQAPQILYASRYYLHLERWFKVFGQDNIKIFSYENLCEDPGAVTKSLCTYLSIPDMPPPDDIESPAGLSLEEPDEKWLSERLREDVERYKALVD